MPYLKTTKASTDAPSQNIIGTKHATNAIAAALRGPFMANLANSRIKALPHAFK
jgi:hypothetical protein